MAKEVNKKEAKKKENKHFCNLTFSNKLGYRIFLMSPWLYKKMIGF